MVEATGFVQPLTKQSTGLFLPITLRLRLCSWSSSSNPTKKKNCRQKVNSSFFGRGDGIRTHGLCVPNAALYQTEPRLDNFICNFPKTTSAKFMPRAATQLNSCGAQNFLCLIRPKILTAAPLSLSLHPPSAAVKLKATKPKPRLDTYVITL